jgi:hypothetical protein
MTSEVGLFENSKSGVCRDSQLSIREDQFLNPRWKTGDPDIYYSCFLISVQAVPGLYLEIGYDWSLLHPLHVIGYYYFLTEEN